MNLHTWALRWGVGFAALADLKAQMGLDDPPAAPATAGHSEAWVQASLRLEASTKGARLWRNNVGALLDDRGIPVRFGLANDNKLVNDRI